MQRIQNSHEYKVVVNREKQYSIWPADGKNPLGWKDVGILGSRYDCFAFIEKVWVEVRPLNLPNKIGSPSIRL
jgi:MbtH protein